MSQLIDTHMHVIGTPFVDTLCYTHDE